MIVSISCSSRIKSTDGITDPASTQNQPIGPVNLTSRPWNEGGRLLQPFRALPITSSDLVGDVMFWRGMLLCVVAASLSGCVSDQVGTDYASIAQKVGPPKPGQSRIVVLQEKRNGLSMALCACEMKLDGEPIGKVIVGTYVYADRPAGRHQLVASEALFPGETARDFATVSGRTYYFLIRSSERHDS